MNVHRYGKANFAFDVEEAAENLLLPSTGGGKPLMMWPGYKIGRANRFPQGVPPITLNVPNFLFSKKRDALRFLTAFFGVGSDHQLRRVLENRITRPMRRTSPPSVLKFKKLHGRIV